MLHPIAVDGRVPGGRVAGAQALHGRGASLYVCAVVGRSVVIASPWQPIGSILGVIIKVNNVPEDTKIWHHNDLLRQLLDTLALLASDVMTFSN